MPKALKRQYVPVKERNSNHLTQREVDLDFNPVSRKKYTLHSLTSVDVQQILDLVKV